MSASAAQVINQMVNQQVRTWHVLDDRVLNALRTIAREPFVPASLRANACADTNLAIGEGQVMLAPTFEGRILQALAPTGTEQALVLGAANAHLAACLAVLTAKVLLLDHDASVLEAARQTLLGTKMNNLAVQVADPLRFGAAQAFDLIAVTGSLPSLPDTLTQSLTIGGRLFAVLGNEPVMQATLVTRSSATQWQQVVLFETSLPLLSGAQRSAEFQF